MRGTQHLALKLVQGRPPLGWPQQEAMRPALFIFLDAGSNLC
jgi:hypothetical protein